jgi:hypothetical protein
MSNMKITVAVQPFELLRHVLRRRACALRDGDHGPLVALELRHRHAVDLALGHDDLLAVRSPEVLAEQLDVLHVPRGEHLVLVGRPHLLADDGALLVAVGGELDGRAVTERAHGVAELPTGLL